jgi:Holliday junction resolvasome RuvABC endonuclease subunit
MILGVDISTSCTGFCVVNDSGAPVHFSYVELTKEKNFFEKAKRVKNHILGLMIKYPIDDIAVEDYLTSFARGRSSSGTLFKLAKFNGIIQWICYNDLDIEALPINVNNARKANSIVVLSKKKTTETTKEQVLRQVKERVGDLFDFPTKILKSGPRKGQEVTNKVSYDMADAFVIAKASWLEKNKKTQ